MVWTKSIGVGLIVVLVFAVTAIALALLSAPREGVAMTSFSPLAALRYLSVRLMLIGAFLLGFGWELQRLGY